MKKYYYLFKFIISQNFIYLRMKKILLFINNFFNIKKEIYLKIYKKIMINIKIESILYKFFANQNTFIDTYYNKIIHNIMR